MIKLIRGWRVLRVGRGRVIRVLMVMVLLVIAWQTLLSRNGFKNSSRSHPGVEGVSKSPNMQVAAPFKETRSSAIPANHQVAPPGQPHPLEDASKIKKHWKDREAVLRGSDNINPRYNLRAMKDKLQPKPVRNQNFLQQNQLNLIDDFQEEDEDEDDDYDEDDEDDDDEGPPERGKWNGRNQDDNAEDNAIEEEDEKANDDFGLEDVGGEKLKKSDGDKNKKSKPSKKKKKKEKKEEEVEENDEGVMEFGELIGERKNDQVDDDDDDDEVQGNDQEEAKDFDDSEFDLDMEAIEKELSHRRSRAQEVCGKYGLGPLAPAGMKPALKYPPTPNYDVFYIDRREELAWCPIYKAASTSWLYNFLILGGVEETYIKSSKEQISTIARRVWPPLEYSEAREAFTTCLKFMIVRHPFERLVSAFRDKLENTNIGQEHGVDHFYKKYGRKIVAKFRPPGQGLPALRYSQDMDDPSIPAPKGVEPTFEEFVKYLIATDLVHYSDDHWMPYYLHCTPCLLDYDVIAKFETLERDQNYIIKKKNLGDKIAPSWKHLTKGIKTSDTVRKYFATITKKDLMDLYEKYKLDFEIFDYSVDEYLMFVRES